MATKYQQIDVWRCMHCDVTYLVPSVPHRPFCPKCGVAGWWQRFATPLDVERNGRQFAASPEEIR